MKPKPLPSLNHLTVPVWLVVDMKFPFKQVMNKHPQPHAGTLQRHARRSLGWKFKPTCRAAGDRTDLKIDGLGIPTKTEDTRFCAPCLVYFHWPVETERKRRVDRACIDGGRAWYYGQLPIRLQGLAMTDLAQ